MSNIHVNHNLFHFNNEINGLLHVGKFIPHMHI